jgi:transposase-like protein
MDMTSVQPEPIPNLIHRVRADGMKIFHPQAREQLMAQARLGQHSVAMLAKINGIPTFLLERWLSGGAKKSLHKSKPKKKSPPTQLLAVKLKLSTSAAPAPLMCEVVLARGSIKLQVDSNGFAQLVQALSA